MNRRRHFVTYPFELLGRRGGGLLSAFLREAEHDDGEVVFITADTAPGTIDGVPVWPGLHGGALSPDDASALRKRWFSAGLFHLLHPDAYTDRGTPRDALRAMYRADGRPDAEFGIERLLAFVDRHAPPAAVELQFNARFDHVFERIPPGSAVHWQDLFFAPSLHRHAHALRARSCRQTLHIHTALPASLAASEWGRALLAAISKVDKVFLHTDTYLLNLEQQLVTLRLPVPALARFDLGIDEHRIQRGLAEVGAMTGWRGAAAVCGLPSSQRDGIAEILESYSRVPHRFMVADRLDAVKGSGVVLDAIDRFLACRLARGESPAQLRARYRFFMLHELWDEPTSTEADMQWQYIRHVREKYDRILQRYPGVIWAMPSLDGDSRSLVPALMRGASALTGGVQDGLHLASMENLVINESQDTGVVAGRGAGFVMQSIAEGHGDGLFAVEPGDVDAFAQGIDQLVTLRERAPGQLRDRKRALVARIRARRARLVDE
jgi:hypothetical protein